jgi:Leucine-rich repeat (LRR) protein
MAKIDISNQQITTLKDIKWKENYGVNIDDIAELNCTGNQLTSLQYAPPNLEEIYCTYNQLTSLQYTPPNLKKLYCYNNRLTSLQYAPPNLEFLDCTNNRLTSLQYTPPNLKKLYCYNNPLQPHWQNLSLNQIKIKNLNRQLITLNAPILKNRHKLIYNTWVSYFDTPNHDNIAKHALLLFKQFAS